MKGNLTTGAKNGSERHDNAAAELANVRAAPTPEPIPAPESAPADTATETTVEQPETVNPQMAEFEKLADEKYESDFFKNGEEDETQAEPEAETSDVPAAETKEKPTKAKTSDSPTIRKIKAAGKMHEVDLSDEKKLDQLLAMGIGGRKAFSEADKLKKEVAVLQASLEEHKKYKEAIDYLDEVKDDDDETFRRVTGGRSLDEAFKRKSERAEFFATATADEIEQFELKERLHKLEIAKEAEAARAAELEQSTEAKLHDTEKKALQSRMATELRKVSFNELVKDPTTAQEWDEAIHAKAGKGIRKYWEKFGDRHPSGVPDALIVREYDRAAKFFKKQFASQVDTAVTDLDKKRSEEATTNAQVASTKNYGKNVDLEAMKKYRGRPTAMWGKGGIFK